MLEIESASEFSTFQLVEPQPNYISVCRYEEEITIADVSSQNRYNNVHPLIFYIFLLILINSQV